MRDAVVAKPFHTWARSSHLQGLGLGCGLGLGLGLELGLGLGLELRLGLGSPGLILFSHDADLTPVYLYLSKSCLPL